jgi:hypothetical protein
MSTLNTNRRPAIESLESRQLMAAQRIFSENFEAGMHGWAEEQGTDPHQAWGIASGFAHSGSKAAATVFSGRDAILHSPSINLPEVNQYNDHLYLRWSEYTDYASRGGYASSAPVVRYFDDDIGIWSAWKPVDINMTTVPQHTAAWGNCGLDLTLFAGARVQVGFSHVGNTNGARGWMVDDVEITKEPIQRKWTSDTSFENGWNGWWSTNGQWDIGSPSGISAASGSKVMGTGLNVAPSDLEISSLVSPAFYLPADPNRQVSLSFKSYIDKPLIGLKSVELQHWLPSYGWMPVDNLSSTGIDIVLDQPAGKWKTFTFTQGFTGATALPYRILFTNTNGIGSGRGWFIDDVKLNYPGKVAQQNPTPTPTPTARPEIHVSNPFGELTDAVTRVMWGTHKPGSGAKDITFTVRNSGNGTLNLNQLVLDNSAGFTIVKQPAKMVAAGGSTTFTIRMSTTTAGTKSAMVRLLSNDADEATFNFNISGLVKV